MRHYRLIALLLVVAAALVIPATGATAPIDQVRGPACADITLFGPDGSGNPVYTTRQAGTTTPGPATVYAALTTAKPSCSGFTYTITVYDATGTTVLDSQTFAGDDTSSSFSYSFSPPGGPSEVCISATSSRDEKVIDAAPNSGCVVIALDTSPGGGGFN